jgi:hypothetical protein
LIPSGARGLPILRTEGSVEPRAVSDKGPQQIRAEWLWTLFGATLLGVFLSYIALTA